MQLIRIGTFSYITITPCNTWEKSELRVSSKYQKTWISLCCPPNVFCSYGDFVVVLMQALLIVHVSHLVLGFSYFARIAIRDYQSLGGLKQQKFISSQLWRLAVCWEVGDIDPLHRQQLVAPGIPWIMVASLHLCKEPFPKKATSQIPGIRTWMYLLGATIHPTTTSLAFFKIYNSFSTLFGFHDFFFFFFWRVL